MKKILALVLSAVMLLSMAACAPANNGDNVTLTAWYYNDPGAAEGYEAWADAVEEKYDWITIELEELPYDSGPEKFTTACATNTTPDLYFDGFSRISPAVFGNLCLDLTDVYTANKDLFSAEVKDGVIDGKNYYIPLQNGGAYGLLVNTTLAKQLGVDNLLPADWTKWTYEDFLNLCRAAKAADSSIMPTALWAGSQSSDAAMYSFFLGNGVDLTNDDLSATAFNTGDNREKSLEVLNFMKTIIDEGLCPAGSATMTDDDLDQLWASGKLLILTTVGFTAMATYQGKMSEGTSAQFDFAPLAQPTPDGTEAPMSVSWGTYGVCAFDKNDAKRTEAVKLALGEMLQTPDYMSHLCTVTGKFPMLKTTKVSYATEKLTEQMGLAAEHSAKYTTSNFGILQPWWTDFRGTFYPQLQDFYTGTIDAGTMLDNWQAAADAVISGK